MDYLDHVSLGKGHGYYNFLVTDTRQNGTSLCFKSDAISANFKCNYQTTVYIKSATNQPVEYSILCITMLRALADIQWVYQLSHCFPEVSQVLPSTSMLYLGKPSIEMLMDSKHCKILDVVRVWGLSVSNSQQLSLFKFKNVTIISRLKVLVKAQNTTLEIKTLVISTMSVQT